MNLYQCFLTENDCYKSGRTIRPEGIMVHSTGANNPKLSRYVAPDDGRLGKPSPNHWNQSGVGACVHAFIGRLANGTAAIYQTLPWTMRGWHAGGEANNRYISFEICEDDLRDEHYFRAVYRQAVELTAFLCGVFSLDPLADGVVICHAEGYRRGIASNHMDVEHWFPIFGKTMDEFRRDTAMSMEEEHVLTYEQWVAYLERYRQELSARPAVMGELFSQAKELGITDGGRPLDFASREECAVMARNALLNQKMN